MSAQAPDENPAKVDAELAVQIIEGAIEYAIFTMQADGVITSWNSGAERLTGYSAQEAVGAHASILFTEADKAADLHHVELRKAMAVGRCEDSRWHVRRNGELFWANGVTMAVQRAGRVALLKVLRDETRSKLADEQRILLLNELNHRIKNTLVTVQSIVEQTLRAGGADPLMRKTLTDRLIALSEAHNILVEESWAGADLRSVIEKAIAPHEVEPGSIFRVDGPPVRLSPHQGVAMALALHELATNALKYGALTTLEGRVEITWNVAQDGHGRRYMNLLWRERGGPLVTLPQHRGFGTRLIAKTFGADSGGAARLAFQPEGLQCVLDLPLSSSDEMPILDVQTPGQGRSRAPAA